MEIEGTGGSQAAAQANLSESQTELTQIERDLQKAALADDVYHYTTGDTAPPTGWDRVSASPEMLAEYGLSLQDLNPGEASGFRAELYVPNGDNIDPNAQPVLAFKGTESSSIEDWANNFGQGVGGTTDYYNRAMAVAEKVDTATGGDFEITGHSLGGGLASAAAAVTNEPAVIFNSAGLHPGTAANYLAQRGGTPGNAEDLVRGYQVEGEILTSVQEALPGLTADNAEQAVDVIQAGLGNIQRAEAVVNTAERTLENVTDALDSLPGWLRPDGLTDRLNGWEENIEAIQPFVQEAAALDRAGAFDAVLAAEGGDLRSIPTAVGDQTRLAPAGERADTLDLDATIDYLNDTIDANEGLPDRRAAQGAEIDDAIPDRLDGGGDPFEATGRAIGQLEATARVLSALYGEGNAVGAPAELGEMAARHGMDVVIAAMEAEAARREANAR
ncbi:DUF2974 domain-containing protein [Pacificimonas sp. WHA3]|uniref:DUF2974 domain-containing protein n=1 Tax=Pacificimonas pallii TaxID=2827236 RepID=A0ABS6SEX3_9SPHN|nr:Mbeg1-like protein [Pacificimonas pallii]MBV7256963.1 DUF2974 domain-containing protein [Pacificimonas pallii]